MADFIDKFRGRLVELEKASGLTEKAFSEYLGLNLNTYRNMKGRTAQGPSLKTLSLLISKLGTDRLVWLLTGESAHAGHVEPSAQPPPGHALVRLPRGDSQPLTNIEADLLEQAITVLRGKGEAKTFANALTEDIKAFHKSVQMANQTSGSGHGKTSTG